MRGAAAVGDVAVRAKLLIAHCANLAGTAASVVVADYPVANLEAVWSAGAQLFDDPARLMTADG